MAFRWHVDDGPTLNVGLGTAIFQRIRTCIARKPYIFVIVQGGGGSGPPVPPLGPHMRHRPISCRWHYVLAVSSGWFLKIRMVNFLLESCIAVLIGLKTYNVFGRKIIHLAEWILLLSGELYVYKVKRK